MTQNSASSPNSETPSKKRRPLWARATGVSIVAHTAMLTLLYFLSEAPQPPAEKLMIVELQQEKPKAKPSEKPTPEPSAQPTPAATTEPTPMPTAEPTAMPTPEKEKPKPVPTKKAVAVKPQPTAMPTPEANEGKKLKPIPTAQPTKAPQKPETKPKKTLGRVALNKTGDGAPKAPAKPKFDEEAGALSGNLKPGEGKNDPNTRKVKSRGSSPNDDPFNKSETGGQNNKPETPLPQGLNNGRPDANRNDLASGKLASNLRGLGRPGGGSSGNFSPNPDKGSLNGVNPELAGNNAGGGANLPRRLAKRGGGGGDDAFFPILNRKSDTAVAVNAPGLSPGLAGGQGGGRGGGAGNISGKGIGTRLAGADRGALNTKVGPGIGGGMGAGVGGPRGSGNGGEVAGGGGGSGGGFGGGNGSGYGAGKGGFGGGNGRGRGRVAGDPFGDPNGSRGVSSNGGGGTGGGPDGPGKGPLLAMRGGEGPGDGKGNGAGRGSGGRGAGGGFGPGRGAGGFGKGPGTGSGKGSGENGKGIGGGNGDGPAGGGGNGDGDAGNGSGIKGRPYRVRPGAQREIEGENSIGRGIWAPGFQIEFFQDTADHPDLPDATFNPGHAIDWPTFTKSVAKKTSPILNFNWGTDPPATGMRHTFWSMKAVGRIFVPKDDTYEFYFDELDDAGRLYLDDKKIIDIWWVQKSTPASKGYFLKKGPHDLIIEYVQGPATAASIKLSWKSTSFPKEIIGVYKPND